MERAEEKPTAEAKEVSIFGSQLSSGWMVARSLTLTLTRCCHIFRDIDIFSAFSEAALLGTTLGKALKMSIYSKIAP